MTAVPDIRKHLQALVGETIATLTGVPNQVVALVRDEVLVGTDRSPSGKPVPLSDIQAATDELFAQGSVDIDKASVGYRSAFVGAVLATLPGTRTEIRPRRVILS